MSMGTGFTAAALLLAVTGLYAQPSIDEPIVGGNVAGDLVLNSSGRIRSSKVLANGVDLIGVIDAQRSMIDSLFSTQAETLERLRILELTQSPTVRPTRQPSSSPTPAPTQTPSASPTTSVPTRDPTPAPTGSPTKAPTPDEPMGTTSSDPGVTCYTLWQGQQRLNNVRNGHYFIDPDGQGGAAPIRVQCDMTGGGYRIVNTIQNVDVGSRHNRQDVTFNTAMYGIPQNGAFRFRNVQATYLFAGELDDSNNYINSYFNNQLISRYTSGQCHSSLITPSGWPVTRVVNSTTFTMGAQPEGDVDVQCGSISSYGENQFKVLKVQIVPV